MTFESQNANYTVVSTLFSGEANCCYMARLSDDMNGRSFTIVAVKDHDVIRTLMEASSKIRNLEDSQLVDAFTYGNDYVLVFPYRQERPLDRFFVGESMSLSQVEEIGTNLLLTCISASLPFPMLYLLLEQGQINLSKDGGIYLTYNMDLRDLDVRRNERDCTVKCAEILREILATKSDQKNISYELISRKSDNNSYNSFTELYRDLRIAAMPMERYGILVRIKSFFSRNADLLFGILFWVCVILGIVALILLLSHVVWGDVPIFRLFINNFKNIGTESLQQ
ncbi:MAG: hypothetical protein IJM27_05375 [Eubacterium sp.]|nr:hypothetical protein [Eubacterium sp.]